MKEYSKRRVKFFEEQYWYAENYLNKSLPISDYKGKKVLEVGSAEGGAVKFFFEKGADVWGIEISAGRNDFAKEYINEPKANFIEGDICDEKFVASLPKMDLIVIRDVIEHIPNKIQALKNMSKLIKEDGIIFLSYPPKYSPYSGHQQNVKKIFGKLPFLHLLPAFAYMAILNLAGESKERVDMLLETKSLTITIGKIEKLFRLANLKIEKKDLYLVRPCFEKRFGMKPAKTFLNKIPVLKEVFSLGALYQLRKMK